MTEAFLKKYGGVFIDVEGKLAHIKNGDVIRGKFTRPRNYAFHQKLFALLNVGYEAFDPEEREYKGFPVQKNFDRFRKDITISAGYYEMVVNLNGEVRAEAKSIAFGNMKEDEFEELFSAVIDVLLQKVLKHYTDTTLRDRVAQDILDFS